MIISLAGDLFFLEEVGGLSFRVSSKSFFQVNSEGAEMLAAVEHNMLATTSIQPGQQIVLICGFPVHAVRPTNMALLHTVATD